MAAPDLVPPAPGGGRRPAGGVRRPLALTIRLSTGSGHGPTSLAAFDAALMAAGVAGFNLVRLSSVIPPGAELRRVAAADQLAGRAGDLLYCVYAEARAQAPGEQAWAGLAWARPEDPARPGLFVEHAGSSEEAVRDHLHTTLSAMAASRGGGYRVTGEALSSTTCSGEPACAVVVATYATDGWSGLNSGG